MTDPDGAPGGSGPTPEQLRRDVDRLADRLRVVAPRLAARDGEPARAGLVALRVALQRLADAAADVEGRQHRRVPELAAHALADQAMVLGDDLVEALAAAEPAGGPGCAAAAAELAALRELLW